ncbi:MAG: 4-hydroxythreonine-4-phosphate dehydrogenase PdxA [Bacteroidales bacterium]|nr:4-hydroxythreonine-4-phosphate dehydrogenase PdxA [Bacteroidales bacterium]
METNSVKRITVGITHGDFNGIGYEIILKVLKDQRLLEYITPVIYGSSKIISYYKKALNLGEMPFNTIRKADMVRQKKNNVINCYEHEVKIETGKLTEKAGELAFLALDMAVNDLKNRSIDILITAPINKNNIQSDNFAFPGHTEYLAKEFQTEDYLMMMVSPQLKIGFVTGHIPIKSINLSIELVLKKLRLLNNSLITDFNISKPKIAVLGLNPHSGDRGLIGSEEQDVIIPAIQESKKEKMVVFGPYSSDGLFGSGNYTSFDGILAIYHDQGMIPFKIISYEDGANYTAGLPFVRTSPAHGTAFDIAGKNLASPDSFRQAIYLAIDIYRNRAMAEALLKDPIPSTIDEVSPQNNTGNHQEEKKKDIN